MEYRGTKIFGLVLIVAGILFMLDNFHIDIFDYFWPVIIILVGLFLIIRGKDRHSFSDAKIDGFKVFGDTDQTDYTGGIDGANINHFIGDFKIRLTEATFKPGLNRLKASSFIGDIVLVVPSEVAVKLKCSNVFGDFRFFESKEEGIIHSSTFISPGYEKADKQLFVNANCFIGDIKIQRI